MAIEREEFGSRIGFILAAAGSAVGIGNLVGFPVNAAKNGGGAFLLIYALFIAFVCLPVMLAELAAGRNSRKNPLGAYKHFAPGSRRWFIAGWSSLITPFMISVFYAVITLWLLGYLVEILSGNLTSLAQPEYFGEFINSKQVFLYLALIIGGTGLILLGGVQKGIEKAAKLMMPILFIVLLILVGFGLTRDNAMAGVAFYLIPDLSKITPSVINGALGQAFFSLSLGMGIMITYGSYMSSKASIPYSAKMVAITDTAVAFVAGLLILPAIFSFNPEVDPAELSSSSVGLVFSYLPKIFLGLQSSVGYFAASVVAAAFFTLVLFAAITSLVSIIEVPVSAVMDELGQSRKQSLLTLGGGIILLTLFCALSFGMVDFFTDFIPYGGGTRSFFDLVIDVFYETILPLNGFLICILVCYRWKRSNMNHELYIGDEGFRGSFMERYIDFALGTFIPAILLLVFINTVLLKFFTIDMIALLF